MNKPIVILKKGVSKTEVVMSTCCKAGTSQAKM